VTSLRDGRPRNRGLIAGGCKMFFQPGSEANPAPIDPGGKGGCEAEHSRPSSTEFKNKWSSTSTLPVPWWRGQGQVFCYQKIIRRIANSMFQLCPEGTQFKTWGTEIYFRNI
jgi:hypothetical protein